MSFSPSTLSAVKEFIAVVSQDSTVLHSSELEFFRSFLISMGATIPPMPKQPAAAAEASAPDMDDDGLWPTDDASTLYVEISAPEGVVDYQPEKEDAAQTLKSEGTELMQNGDFEQAIAKFTEALKLCPAKAPYWAFRAQAYLKWKKPHAAIKDASEALRHNPENAKALRTRGMARRRLGLYEEASLDLNAANRVDYDPELTEMIKFVDERAHTIRAHRRQVELSREQEELKRRAREAAARQAESAAPSCGAPGGMPGMPPGGMPAGMPPGMEGLFSDPDVMEALKDPETAAKLQQIMGNPMAAMQYMSDPKIATLMQKMMGKMGGMPGGMPGGMGGGMPGGMGGGMPGGMGGGMPGGM
eukprot:PhM_4_TR165/c0_g1_i1/m.53076/K09560/ST13; suppressor of tumorigenicity protein 13